MKASLLFYVRHGETVWNREGRLQGQHDSELTALGRAQAVHCGEILRQVLARDGARCRRLDFVSSSLGRTRATMEVMRAALGLEPVDYRTDARLAELAFGRWEGVANLELLAHEHDPLAARERDKWNFRPAGGESYADLLVRVRAWHATLRHDSVVVAHGGTARAFVALRAASRSGRRLRPSPSTRASFACSPAEALRDTTDEESADAQFRVPRRSAKKRPDLHVRPPESASTVANARQAAMR
jgi:broad specificity phosphatase PhoE